MTEVYGELADCQEFFAPSSTDMVDGLIGQYRRERGQIEQVDQFLRGDGFNSVLGYFISGNGSDRHRGYIPSAGDLFKLEGAIASLNSSYWDRSLKMTDVLGLMPQSRRDEWFEQIQSMKTPDFDEETVRATISELLAQRMNFLAERVDGIFRALSRTHVTNQPEGFSKRMILTGVTNDWGSFARSQTGRINDLRAVVAKFMGRDEPDWNASNRMVEICRKDYRGEWVSVDGGAIRIRCYNNGNAHLEVHPEMSWRLNQILAHLHPSAIPSRFREAPKRKPKEFTLMDRPLPFAVLDVLHGMKPIYDSRAGDGDMRHPQLVPNSRRVETGCHQDKVAVEEAERVLELLGGVRQGKASYHWHQFDYDPSEVIREIVVTGCIPDQKSHQFYPTPERVARDAVELAEIDGHHHCLEPSAGTGNLADQMGGCGSITCVEISSLHCAVLQSKGYYVEQADFLKWGAGQSFDRIVMNPPYSQGRWQAHIDHAATLLRPGGRMVAILPSSAKGKDVLPGLSLTWSRVYKNQFRGASVDVVILAATRAAA